VRDSVKSLLLEHGALDVETAIEALPHADPNAVQTAFLYEVEEGSAVRIFRGVYARHATAAAIRKAVRDTRYVPRSEGGTDAPR
jgi:hypothetical protein